MEWLPFIGPTTVLPFRPFTRLFLAVLSNVFMAKSAIRNPTKKQAKPIEPPSCDDICEMLAVYGNPAWGDPNLLRPNPSY